MRTLIVLCAGNRVINGKPLYLNIHPDGKMIAEKAIEGICPQGYDRVIYAILKETDTRFGASDIIKKTIGVHLPVEVVALDRPTSGPAETVYETVLKADIKGELVVRDSLNAVCLSKEISGNFVAGLDLTKFDEDVLHIKTKSFVVENEQHRVLDIVEKKLRSDMISVGLYGFKNTNDFMLSYGHLIDKNYSIKKLYLSHIISYLIGYSQRIFQCVEVNDFEDFGSEEAWAILQKRYAICFIDLDMLLEGCGIGGLFEKLSVVFKKNSRIKIKCIAFTVKSGFDESKIMDVFKMAGIHCLGVVGGVSHSDNRIVINDFHDLINAAKGV